MTFLTGCDGFVVVGVFLIMVLFMVVVVDSPTTWWVVVFVKCGVGVTILVVFFLGSRELGGGGGTVPSFGPCHACIVSCRVVGGGVLVCSLCGDHPQSFVWW